MADIIFENARLASIYDAFDGERDDLDHYLAIAKEFNAKSILDVGCGTGCLAHLFSKNGFNVIGVDPAKASIDIARSKLGSSQIEWIVSEAQDLKGVSMDMAYMTGNVAQVFVSQESWLDNLRGIKNSLMLGGRLVFEVRDPAQEAWLGWTPDETRKKLKVPGEGYVEAWCEVTNVSNSLVSFRWTYLFESDGQKISSDSTICFREKDEIIESLSQSGFAVDDVRDAPDRPGKEFVFIARALE